MFAELATLVILGVFFNRRGGKSPLSRCINANPDAEFFVGIQTASNNFEYGAFASATDFARAYIPNVFTPGCHCDEVIRDNVPVKLFMDVDSKTGPVSIADLMDVVNRQAKANGFKLNQKKVLVDTSHGDGKHSYHIVYDGPERFKNMSHLKSFMTEIKDELGPYGVDLGVYEKNHMLRIHGSSRHGSTRYMANPGDVTRKKSGQPNAPYRRFIEARLITNTDGHKKTIETIIKANTEPEVSDNQRMEK